MLVTILIAALILWQAIWQLYKLFVNWTFLDTDVDYRQPYPRTRRHQPLIVVFGGETVGERPFLTELSPKLGISDQVH
jgi:hypothetical protein